MTEKEDNFYDGPDNTCSIIVHEFTLTYLTKTKKYWLRSTAVNKNPDVFILNLIWLTNYSLQESHVVYLTSCIVITRSLQSLLNCIPQEPIQTRWRSSTVTPCCDPVLHRREKYHLNCFSGTGCWQLVLALAYLTFVNGFLVWGLGYCSKKTFFP